MMPAGKIILGALLALVFMVGTASAAYNVYIVSGTPPSPSGTWDSGGDPQIWTADSSDSQLYVEDILVHLSVGDVQINTGTSGSQAGNLYINAPVSYSGSNSHILTLIAANDINVNSAVSGSNLNMVFNPGDTAAVNSDLTIGSLGISQGTLALHSAATVTGTTTIGGSGTLRVGDGGTSGALQTGTIFNNNALVFDRSDTITVPNSISGTGSLMQSGTGTTILTGANSYHATIINGGTLQVGNGGTTGTLGTGPVDNPTGSSHLVFFRSDTITIPNNIGSMSAIGHVVLAGGGTTILTGTNSYVGMTIDSGSTVQVGDGSTGLLTVINAITDDGVLIYDCPGTHTVPNDIGGTGSLGQIGGGTLILTGTNTYSGTTTTDSGSTLVVGDGGTTGSLGSGSVTNNGVLVFARSDTVTIPHDIIGHGTLMQGGTGTTILTGTNTYDATIINGGTLQVGNGGTTGTLGTGPVDNPTGSSHLVFFRSDTITIPNNIGSMSAIGHVVLAGGGTTILTGTNSYVGMTIDSGSTVQVGDGSTGLLMVMHPITDDGVLIFDCPYPLVDASPGGITGTGSLEQAGTGTLTLTRTNTYSGTTTIHSGSTLQVGDGGTTGTLGTGSVTDNGWLLFDRADILTIINDISGTGSLEQTGTGTTIITNPATYTGTTTVSAGELRFNGMNTGVSAMTVSGGTLAGAGTIPVAVTVADVSSSRLRGGTGPGNAGTLTITGPLAFSGTSSALDVTSDGTGLSGISLTGPLTVPSGMTVNLLDPMSAGTYTLITDTGTLPATLPTLGTNFCGKTPVFAWVPGTGLVVTLYTLPAITGISPASGTVAGGTGVTITGIGFADGATVTFGGTPATDVVFVNPSTITATTPANLWGAVDVVVTNPDTQHGTLTNGFSYRYDPPVVVKVEPSSGSTLGGTEITITGTGFRDGTEAFLEGSGWFYSPVTIVVNSSTIIFRTQPFIAGPVNVLVANNNPDGSWDWAGLPNAFTFVDPPAVTAVSPRSGPAAGGTSVTITGTGFTGVTAVIFGSTPATSYTVNSAGLITAIAPPAVSAGTVDITVTSDGGTSEASPDDRFTYIPPLVVTGVSPKVGPTAGGTGVTITGTGFTDTVAVYFGSTEVRFVVRSDTEINANSPAGTAGTVDIIVANATGTSPVSPDDEFIYSDVPIVTGVSPDVGPVAGGTDVTITGYGFTRAVDVYFGSTAVRYAVRSDTEINAASPPGTAGTVDITVTYPGGTTATSPADRFMYFALPAVSSISPAAGPTSGRTSVTITGTDFTGATAVSFGGNAAVITSNTGTVITATSPAGTAGTVDVTVTTPGGTSATSPADRFTYTNTPTTAPTTAPTTVPTTALTTAPTTVPVTMVTTTSPDNSDNSDGGGSTSGSAASSSATGTDTTIPPMTVTINIGGDSKAWQAVVTGTKLTELIVTGTVQSGSGSNLTAPPGTVFQYISLVPARYGTISNAAIYFSIPQSWLDDNHIAPGSIVLYHQTANGWEALPTMVVSTKDGTIYFSAQSTGFSLFAIAGTPVAPAPATVATTQVTADYVTQTPAPAPFVKAPVTTQTTAPPATTPQPAAPSPLLNIVLVIAAIGVLAGGGFMARRWWIRRQNPALFEER